MSALPPKATSNATYECLLRARSGHPDGASPPTQIIEGVQGRTDLLTDFGLWVDVLKSVDQRGIFGTQFFSQFVHSVKQRIEFPGIPRLVSLLDLVTEPGHLAINSGLGFVAADDFENLLRVRLGHLRWGRRLSLHTWRGSDHKSCKEDRQVSVMPLPTMIADPKKVTKCKKISFARAGGRGHVEHAFCVLFLDCRRSKPIRYSSQSVTDLLSKLTRQNCGYRTQRKLICR